MPTYLVTAPDGRKLRLTGDSPPNKQALDDIFDKVGKKTAAPDSSPLDSTAAIPPADFSKLDLNKIAQEDATSKAYEAGQNSSDFLAATTAPGTGIPAQLNKAVGYAGNIAKAIPADVAETVAGNEKYYELKNLAGAALGEEPQITGEIAGVAPDAPAVATLAKFGQGLAGSAPMLAIAGLPEGAAKLASLGFSAQMIKSGGDAATVLGTELGKNPEDRDKDKITSAVSDLAQSALFAPLAAKFGATDAIESRARPKDYLIRKLAEQLRTAPVIPTVAKKVSPQAQEEPLTHGDEVKATMPDGKVVSGHVIGADVDGNAQIIQQDGKIVTLPEKLTEEKPNAIQEPSTAGVPVNPSPGDSEAVGAGIPEPEKPAEAPQGQASELPKAGTVEPDLSPELLALKAKSRPPASSINQGVPSAELPPEAAAIEKAAKAKMQPTPPFDTGQKGIIYEGDKEKLADWVKPGQWVKWNAAFNAPKEAGTEGAWLGKIISVKPKATRAGYDKVEVLHPGETEPESIYANQIESINPPDTKSLSKYTKAYTDWRDRSESQPSPQESARPTEQGKPSKRIIELASGKRGADLIDEIEGVTGKIDPTLIKEANSNWKPIGAARSIFRKGGVPADVAASELSKSGHFKGDPNQPDQLGEHLNQAAKGRIASREAERKKNALHDQAAAQTVKFQSDIKSKSKGVETLVPDDLNEGDHFTLKGAKLKVTRLDYDEDGRVTGLTLDDGNTYGTQEIDGETALKMDKGSLVSKPKEALFAESEMPFNLAGEKFVEPTSETTAYGNETLTQNDLFKIQEIVKDVDPEKSATAAEKMYSGAAKAAKTIEKQLSIMASDAKNYKSFDKVQRKRLQDVLSLLRQRSEQPPAEHMGLGAAVPSEFARGGGNPTAMKYKLIDQERQKRGLPPLTKPEGVSDQALMDRAMAEIDKNPTAPDTLIADLNSKPRTIEGWERMMLLLRKIDLRDAYEKSARAAIQAFDDSKEYPDRLSDMVGHNIETARLSDELTQLEHASRVSGSETGRALRSLQIMANEDYSLASLELQRRAVKGGEPLTDSERAELVKTADDYKKANDELQQHLDRSQQSEAEAKRQLDEILKQPKPQPVEPHVRIIADKIKNYFDARADAALKRLNSRLYSVSPGLIADVTDVGVSTILKLSIEAGQKTVDLGEWTAEMTAKLGKDFIEKYKPNFDDFFRRANEALENHTAGILGGNESKAEKVRKVQKAVKDMTVPEQIARTKDAITKKFKAGKKDGASNAIQKLARLFVESGVKDRDALIDAVHGALQEIDPTIERRDTMDAISGYGDFKQLSKDEVSVTLRDLKRQMQEVAKLEDMAAGQPPLKTGVERAEVTKAQSALIKLVNEAKLKFQVPITDPHTQLKSALDTFKTRLQNQIDEYQRRLDEKDYDKKPRRVLQVDRKAMELQGNKNAIATKFKREQFKYQKANLPRTERFWDFLANARRFSVLSGVNVLGKLAGYSITKVPMMIAQDVIGGVISKLPKVRDVAENAPVEGGSNIPMLTRSIARGLTQGMFDAYKVATTGESELKRAFSTRIDDGFEWWKIPQLLHEVIKSPLRRVVYENSLARRLDFIAKNGGDPTDPLTQLAAQGEAFMDSDEGLLLEQNKIASGIRSMFKNWERPKKLPNREPQVPLGGKIAATAGRIELPILTVPLNYIKQQMTAAFGLASGSYKLHNAFKVGIDKLSDRERDNILKHLKVGSIGAAMALYGLYDGWHNGANGTFGGYYQPGEKRKPDQAGVGGIKIGDTKLSGLWLINPILADGQLFHTIGVVAASKLKKGSKDNKGLVIGAIAGASGLLNDSPLGRTSETITQLGQPSSISYGAGEWMKNLLVPQLVNEAAQWQDKDAKGNPIKRQPSTVGQHIETGVPYLRENVPAKKDKSTRALSPLSPLSR
jgi:hypothetical protein